MDLSTSKKTVGILFSMLSIQVDYGHCSDEPFKGCGLCVITIFKAFEKLFFICHMFAAPNNLS